MRPVTKGLLVLSSVLNAALCLFVFFFALFATSPTMQDVTMRIGFYVLNAVALAAAVSVFTPWIYASKQDTKRAIFLSLLPFLLMCLAIVAFLTLDSWLNRTFSSLDMFPDVTEFLTVA